MHARHTLRFALAVLACTTAVVWVDTSGTLGGFGVAKVTSTASARAALLSITHSQGSCAGTQASTSPVACTSTVFPATSTTRRGQSDTITNTGTYAPGAVTVRYRVASCGAVDLANAKVAANVMMPRGATTFAPTDAAPPSSFGSTPFGAITLASGAYASNISSSTQPGFSVFGSNYGLGIWFRTSNTGTQSIFGFGSNALNVVDAAKNNDRVLYLSGGKIGYSYNTAGATTTPAVATGVSGANGYADGAWHFAYVMYGNGVLNFGGNDVAVFVDGKQVGSTLQNLTFSTGYTGYWHLGWSPVGGVARSFTGSLSGFTVDDGGRAPASNTSIPTSYTSFDTTYTQQWQLRDSGGSFDGTTTSGTYTGTALPAGGDPCSYLNATWTVTAPTQIVASAATLRSLSATAATGTATTLNTWISGTEPAVGTPQTSTISLDDGASFNSYGSGLIMYVPVQLTYTVTATSSWTVSFVFANPPTSSSTGSTFVIA